MTKDNPFSAFSGDLTELQKETLERMAAAGIPVHPGMVNLAAHPMAAMAAASAVSMGVASQMFGLMMGSMAGAMKSASMLAEESTDGPAGSFGLANPLDFDLATGSFDDKVEPDTVKPVEAEKSALAAKKSAPAARARPAPKPKAKAAAPAKPVIVKKEAAPIEEPVADSAVKVAPKTKVKATAAPKVSRPKPVAVPVRKEIAETPPIAAAEPVMPEDFIKPKSIKKPKQPDDLKVISGIGPKLENVLNSLGIWTYQQIAALTSHEIAWVDDYLQFKGRIERDTWVSQAAALAKKAK